MKRLYLLRHATPEAEPAGDDAARALTPEGRAEAQHVGRHLRTLCPAPPLALVSSARRAVETFTAVCEGYGTKLACDRSDALYLCSPDTWIHHMKAQPDDRPALLLVGHNPGLARLAYELLRPSEETARERIARGFVPATLVALALDIEGWVEVERGRARATDVFAPGD